MARRRIQAGVTKGVLFLPPTPDKQAGMVVKYLRKKVLRSIGLIPSLSDRQNNHTYRDQFWIWEAEGKI